MVSWTEGKVHLELGAWDPQYRKWRNHWNIGWLNLQCFTCSSTIKIHIPGTAFKLGLHGQSFFAAGLPLRHFVNPYIDRPSLCCLCAVFCAWSGRLCIFWFMPLHTSQPTKVYDIGLGGWATSSVIKPLYWPDALYAWPGIGWAGTAFRFAFDTTAGRPWLSSADSF